MGDLKEELKKQEKDTLERYKKIAFQVDTIPENAGFGGVFSQDNNSITINYVKEDDKFNSLVGVSTLEHEQKHRDNTAKGIYSKPTSLEQRYKLNIHDEISANMAELITIRDEYIRTGDISIFEKNPDFEFYGDAIKNKEIDPLKSHLSKEDFDKDMSLIANGTQKMWMEEYSDGYVEQNVVNAGNFYKIIRNKAVPNEDNYKAGMDIAYNIGGVNFTKYIKNDIECKNADVINADEMIANGEKGVFASFFGVEMPEYEENISLEQYYKLTQHKVLAESIEEHAVSNVEFNNFSEEERNKYLKDLKDHYEKSKEAPDSTKTLFDTHITEVLDGRVLAPSKNNKVFEKEVENLYTINGVNYKELLNIDANEDVPFKDNEDIKNFEGSNIIKRTFNKAKSFFSSKEKLSKDELDKIETEKKLAPKTEIKYGTWSPENRVSEVQYREVLDLDKPVIAQPSAKEENRPVSEKAISSNAEVPQKISLTGEEKSQKTNAAGRFAELRGISPLEKKAEVKNNFSFDNNNMIWQKFAETSR